MQKMRGENLNLSREGDHRPHSFSAYRVELFVYPLPHHFQRNAGVTKSYKSNGYIYLNPHFKLDKRSDEKNDTLHN